MILHLVPQVRDFNRIWYEIEDQKITATINGVSDTFDFTDVPNGMLQLEDEEGNRLTETTLDEVPILSARKEDGVLTVEIFFSLDMEEKDERLLFPDPMTVDEFNDLMVELEERDRMLEDDEEDPEDVGDETENIDLEEVDF